MTLATVVEKLGLKIITGEDLLHKEVSGGFVCDLLSLVMGKARKGQVWVTIQSHVNVVAVAALIDLSCVIVTEGFTVEPEAVEKAREEDVAIFTTNGSSYETVRALIDIGL